MKIFIYKSVIFIGTLVILQALIARYLMPLPQVALLETYLRAGNHIIYFGDSVIQNSPSSDTDHDSIVRMLERMRPGYAVGDLSHPGYHLGIFAAEMGYISRSSSKPEGVVVPIQLRSFSPEWDLRPENQFERDIFSLTDSTQFVSLFYQPLAIFRAIDANSVPYGDFLTSPVYRGTTRVGTVNDFESMKRGPVTPEKIKQDYIYKYMYDLNLGHRKIVALRDLMETAARAGVDLYIYIAPIDYQGGIKYIGADLTKQVSANADLICRVVTDHSLPCLNLAFSLSSDYFDYPEYPNEHMNQQGRLFVATQLSGLVR